MEKTFHRQFNLLKQLTRTVLCLILLSGCTPKVVNSLEKNNDNVQENFLTEHEIAINEIAQIYEDGKLFFELGDFDSAFNCFNSASQLCFNQPPHISKSRVFKEYFYTLTNNIHSFEIEKLKEGDSYTETDIGDSELNALLDNQFTFLSDEETLEELDKIKKKEIEYDIPVVLNNKVLSMIKSYSTRLKPVITATLKRSGRYINSFREIFREEGVPQDLAYLPIIESGYKSHALSRAKAKGIWQFMTGTARMEGLTVNWWVDERCHPEKATRAAAKHLKRLYNHFDDWYLALAAYNAGQGKIDRAIRKTKTRDFWKIADRKWILRNETRNYVPAFLATLVIAKNPEEHGFDNLEFDSPLNYDEVTLTSCTDLRVISQLAESTVRHIQEINPHIRRLTTPVSEDSFDIYIPAGKKDKFLEEYKKLPENKRVTLRYHKVKNGQTLSWISKKYQTTVSAICKSNNIRNKSMIRAGQTIVIPIGQGHDYYAPAVRDFTVKSRAKYPTGKKCIHTVRRGDTVFGIARKYSTNSASIIEWNSLSSSLLRPGQRIVAYYNKSAFKKKTEKKFVVPEGYYKVREGDSLYSIAKKFKMNVNEIKKLNKLTTTLIKPGDLIKVSRI